MNNRSNISSLLMVDDEPIILDTIQKIAKKLTPHHVDTAENGLVALDKWKSSLASGQPYDLMVVDLRMPKMDGKKLIQNIREKDIDTDFIILTGHGDLSDAYQMLEDFHISDFLKKPLSEPEVLLFSIENALEKRRLRHQLQEHVNNLNETQHTLIGKNEDLRQMADQLAFTNAQIEKRVVERTADLQDALDKLNKEIQERKAAESEKFRLATALEQTAEAIFILDTDGMIQYVNPAFNVVTGYSFDEVKGKHIGFLSSESQDPLVYETMWNTIKDNQVWKGRLSSRKKDGTLYEEELTVSPITDEIGTIIDYVFVTQDVTEKLQLEEQLRQAQKMEAIGTLAGGIAHDFNNILGTMLGYTQLMLNEKDENTPEHEYLREIHRAGERGSELVQRILTFSRMEEKLMKPVNLVPLVEETIKLMRATLPATIEILSHVSQNINAILGNATQLRQVIVNLCTNAWHAMEDDRGVLEIELHKVSETFKPILPTDSDSNQFAELIVKDDGIGIPTEYKNRIFEPFFTTKEVGKGTGLGLSIVHGIVKNHRGEIQVDSEPGSGTEFRLYFPILEVDVAEPTEEGQTTATAAMGKEHVLIVDDEKPLVRVYELVLKKKGYQVTTAYNGLDAIKKFKENPDRYDLVFTDQTMPDITGDRLSRELLKIRPDIPIILATGYSSVISESEAKRIGIRHFLYKPVKVEQLFHLIREIYDENQSTIH